MSKMHVVVMIFLRRLQKAGTITKQKCPREKSRRASRRFLKPHAKRIYLRRKCCCASDRDTKYGLARSGIFEAFLAFARTFGRSMARAIIVTFVANLVTCRTYHNARRNLSFCCHVGCIRLPEAIQLHNIIDSKLINTIENI